jgi:hypothetical protein
VLRSFLTTASLLLIGCPDGPTEVQPNDAGADVVGFDAECAAGFLGDPARPIDFEFRALRSDGTDNPLHEGDDVALILPPQGGRVVFLGVRATNLDGCAVTLTGAFRDETTKQAVFDKRTVNLNPTGDGWGTSGAPSQTISAARDAYANVPLCPNQWASVDIFDREFVAEVTVEDRAKRKLVKSIKVTPRCAEPENKAECLCICKHGYILGERCDADAGSDG